MTKYVKEGLKTVAIGCSSFDRHTDNKAVIYGLISRGASFVEGVIRTRVTVDGKDATEKIGTMILKSQHKEQLNLIMIKGVTLAGFNYIDCTKLSERTKLPVIVVSDRKPDSNSIRKALENLDSTEERIKVILEGPTPKTYTVSGHESPIFTQWVGLTNIEVNQILEQLIINGRIPEPLRVVRLIATAKDFS